MHTKVSKKFDANRVILPHTINNMEKSEGLSTVLKQRYTMTAMVAHLLVAMTTWDKGKTYPKFYPSTIANDVN